MKNRNELTNNDKNKLTTSNNLHTLFEFEIVDHSNIQDMMKAIINLCESTLSEIANEKNLTLNYSYHIEDLKKIEIFIPVFCEISNVCI